MKALLAAMLCLQLAGSQGPRDPCLLYDPAVVTLEGRLIRREYPGPPNYESVAKGDQADTALVLVLSKPICVAVDSAQKVPDDEPESGITEVQLGIDADSVWSELRHLDTADIRVTGTLYHAITGHHHTKVLVSVTRLGAV